MLTEELAGSFRPRLRGEVVHDATKTSVRHGGMTFEIVSDNEDVSDVYQFLTRLDGNVAVTDAARGLNSIGEQGAIQLLETLDDAGLIDDDAIIECRSAAEFLLELEDLAEELCSKTVFKNPFWTACLAASEKGDLSQSLATGMVIENWHLLFRESYFDAPVLSYVPQVEVRLAINRFFAEEYGHDEILLQALTVTGLSRADLLDSIPLPETMALCNSLAYWAHNDPIFFFSTLGLLEGQGLKKDTFIAACERSRLPFAFIEPLRIHSNININAKHGNLTRELFQHLPPLSRSTEKRLCSQMHIFIELYDDFYSGVWEYYSHHAPPLRRVNSL